MRLLTVLALGFAATWCSGSASAASATPDWPATVAAARGHTVYFNAWAGDEAVNRYIAWAAHEVQRDYGIRLVHVKLNDVAEAVTRILAEHAVHRDAGGSVDLLWINGENFATLKQANLLHGPWTQQLPDVALLNTRRDASLLRDFTLPTAGYELPWGTSRFTFFYDSAAVPVPPTTPAALLTWIRAHPGRFTYPQPPQFHGTSFLIQLLLALTSNHRQFEQPVGADFDAVTAPLWQWLDAAHPFMWRKGRNFPVSGPAQRRLMGDGEVDWAMGFNGSEASRAIASGELPPTVRAMRFSAGALANSHFLAIPYNASQKAAAMVVANFLISPAAQLRKADETYWGDATVLALEALPSAERARFAALKRGPATPPDSGPVLEEPHPSWSTALERGWALRYRAP